MDENKNQNQARTTAQISADGIMVKDFDGRLKVLAEGELKELDTLLSSSIATPASSQPVQAHNAGMELAFPKFTDLAQTPHDSHFREPKHTADSNAKAELHFHPEDKNEIEQELKKINALFHIVPQKKYSVIKMAHKLSEKHNLSLSEVELRILTKTLLTYFQQTRNLIQTRVVFSTPRKEGGLGMEDGTADRIVSIIKHLKIKIEETDGVVVEEEGVETPTAPTPKVLPVTPVPMMPKKTATPAPELLSVSAGLPTPVKPTTVIPGLWPTSNTPQEQKTNAIPAAPALPKPTPQSAVATMTTSAPTPSQSVPRVTRPESAPASLSVIQEVKRGFFRPNKGQLTGRLEELASMDLATWRLLDEDPRIAAGKILGKIQNLEQESLTRRSQGIEAWRGNEVYRHYLTLGQASLEQKKDVAEVIKVLDARGEKTLTLVEFEAISDLNRMFRF